MADMKIAHITALYHPFVGGLEIAVKRVSEELARMGYNVYVITSDAAGGRGYEEINGVKVFRVRSVNIASRYPYLIAPIEIPRNILKDVDVVHGWSQSYYFTYKISKYAKEKLGKTLAYYFIGVDYLENHYNPLIRFAGSRFQKSLTKALVKHVNLALVTNERDRELLKGRYGVEANVIPHGVDDIYFKLPNQAEVFRSKYGIYDRIVSFIGRIHPTKGVDLLVKAFSEVVREERDITLVIVGRGSERYLAKCLSLAKKLGVEERVRYIGYIPEEDKIGLIDASEVVVMPSRHAGENYSLIVDEVKARGKPLVVTNHGALPYRVMNGIEGVVVKPGVHDIANGILYVIQNKDKFHVISKPMTWREVVLEIHKVYSRLFKK